VRVRPPRSLRDDDADSSRLSSGDCGNGRAATNADPDRPLGVPARPCPQSPELNRKNPASSSLRLLEGGTLTAAFLRLPPPVSQRYYQIPRACELRLTSSSLSVAQACLPSNCSVTASSSQPSFSCTLCAVLCRFVLGTRIESILLPYARHTLRGLFAGIPPVHNHSSGTTLRIASQARGNFSRTNGQKLLAEDGIRTGRQTKTTGPPPLCRLQLPSSKSPSRS